MGQVNSEQTRGDAFGEDGFVQLERFFSPPQVADVLANSPPR